MLWIFLAVLVLWGGYLMVNRRRHPGRTVRQEPWRASLEPDAPLDLEEIRRAEEEWLADEGWQSPSDDEEWR